MIFFKGLRFGGLHIKRWSFFWFYHFPLRPHADNSNESLPLLFLSNLYNGAFAARPLISSESKEH